MVIKRNRTSAFDIERALYLYFLGLSTRCVAKALLFLHNVKKPCFNLEMDSKMSS
ncbi:MAG: hypothetical protein AB7V56_13415 [Candidatus Nitrosocosmicus sp.]